jgi:ribosomal protein L21E
LYFFVKLKIMIYFYLFLITLCFSDDEVNWPIPERKGLTSSFGEWRDGHLHAGIDLPISRIGEKVYSIGDGWVIRVRTSPWGYGKAVYIKNNKGEIFVYAHLDSFFGKLDKKVRKEQLRKFSYAVDMWFKEGEVSVEKGGVIAYAGRSGCSAPHLHFEMRDKNNNPVDPFTRGFDVPDTVSPVINAVRFVPLDDSSKVFDYHSGKVLEVKRDTVSICVEGRVGIEVEAEDRVNNRSGRLGIKESRLYKNGRLIRKEFVDRFSYSNYTDSRFLFNFEYGKRTGRKFRRLFAVPGNRFSFCEGGDGIITEKDTGSYLIEVYDGSGNKSCLVIGLLDSLRNEGIKSSDPCDKEIIFETNGFQVYGKWFDLRLTKKFLKSGDSIAIWNFSKKEFSNLESSDGKCKIILNKGETINTKLIAVRTKSGEENIWHWEPPVPFKRKVKIKIKIPLENKFISLYEKNGSQWSFCSSKKEGAYLVDFIDHLGTFGLREDSIPPVVSLGQKYFSSKVPLKISVWDTLSGVDFSSIKTLIDNNQTVFRYDPQKKRLLFEYPEEISKGKHRLELSLSDKQGNKVSKIWQIVKN